jgi:hypothetical protein
MSRYGYLLWVVLLGIVASITLACGVGSFPQRQIVSLTVSPPSADAQNYPNGQVQFTATGTFTAPPVTVTPLQSTWVAVGIDGPTTDVTISPNGLAQCASGASGVYSVGAWVALLGRPPGALCNIVSPFGNPCGDSVLGTAQLTCP